jgi:hypothetical protein
MFKSLYESAESRIIKPLLLNEERYVALDMKLQLALDKEAIKTALPKEKEEDEEEGVAGSRLKCSSHFHSDDKGDLWKPFPNAAIESNEIIKTLHNDGKGFKYYDYYDDGDDGIVRGLIPNFLLEISPIYYKADVEGRRFLKTLFKEEILKDDVGVLELLENVVVDRKEFNQDLKSFIRNIKEKSENPIDVIKYIKCFSLMYSVNIISVFGGENTNDTKKETYVQFNYSDLNDYVKKTHSDDVKEIFTGEKPYFFMIYLPCKDVDQFIAIGKNDSDGPRAGGSGLRIGGSPSRLRLSDETTSDLAFTGGSVNVSNNNEYFAHGGAGGSQFAFSHNDESISNIIKFLYENYVKKGGEYSSSDIDDETDEDDEAGEAGEEKLKSREMSQEERDAIFVALIAAVMDYERSKSLSDKLNYLGTSLYGMASKFGEGLIKGFKNGICDNNGKNDKDQSDEDEKNQKSKTASIFSKVKKPFNLNNNKLREACLDAIKTKLNKDPEYMKKISIMYVGELAGSGKYKIVALDGNTGQIESVEVNEIVDVKKGGTDIGTGGTSDVPDIGSGTEECEDTTITHYVKRIALLNHIINNDLETIKNGKNIEFTPDDITIKNCAELGIIKDNITKNFTTLGNQDEITTLLEKIKTDYKLNGTTAKKEDYERDKLVVEIFKLVAQIVALSVKIKRAGSGAGASVATGPASGGAVTPTLESLKTQIDDIVTQEKARLKSMEGKTPPSTDVELTEIIKLIDAELNKMKALETQVNDILPPAPSP